MYKGTHTELSRLMHGVRLLRAGVCAPPLVEEPVCVCRLGKAARPHPPPSQGTFVGNGMAALIGAAYVWFFPSLLSLLSFFLRVLVGFYAHCPACLAGPGIRLFFSARPSWVSRGGQSEYPGLRESAGTATWAPIKNSPPHSTLMIT